MLDEPVPVTASTRTDSAQLQVNRYFFRIESDVKFDFIPSLGQKIGFNMSFPMSLLVFDLHQPLVFPQLLRLKFCVMVICFKVSQDQTTSMQILSMGTKKA